MSEAYCTTGCFARLGTGYDRHCGPTAVTNLVLTLEEGPEKPRPSEVRQSYENETFLRIAKMGAKSRIYWNTSFFGHFGGTSDWLVLFLIRRAIREHGLPARSVKGPFLIRENNLRRELHKGNILYLMVHGNPRYKSHHMLCYGEQVRPEGILFRVADGWKAVPQYLPAKELRYGLFYAVSKAPANKY